MKTLLLFLCLAVSGLAEDSNLLFDPAILDAISESDIEKTVEHMDALNKDLKGKLKLTEKALDDADAFTRQLSMEVDDLTKDRNTQAELKDTALDQIVADLKLINQLREESGKLKTVVAGAVTLVAALGLLLVGAPKLCMPWGIIGCVALLPLIFFSVRSML